MPNEENGDAEGHQKEGEEEEEEQELVKKTVSFGPLLQLVCNWTSCPSVCGWWFLYLALSFQIRTLRHQV